MKEYFHGKIAGVRLHDVSRSVLELLPRVDSVVLRSIDSTVAPESLRQILDLHEIPFHWTNGNILLSKELLLFAFSKRLFAGFANCGFLRKKAQVMTSVICLV